MLSRTLAMLIALSLSCVAPAEKKGVNDPAEVGGAASLALVGMTVYESAARPPIVDGVVVIRGDRVAAVGPRAKTPIPAGTPLLELPGGTVTAGFWNAHVHFVDVFAPKWGGADSLPAEDLTRRLHDTFTRFGYTSVVDLGSPLENTLAIRRRITEGEVVGPNILSAGMLIFPRGGVPPAARAWKPPEAGTPEEGRAAVRRELAEGADLIKIATAYFTPEGIEVMPLEVVAAIVHESHGAGKLVVAHPENVEGLRNAVTGGADIIAHTTEAGGAWPPALVDQMVDGRLSLVPTIYLYELGVRFKQLDIDAEEYVRSSGVLDQLRTFSAAGGRVLFGTDVGFYPEVDMTKEYEWMARAGLGWREILASLTDAPSAVFRGGEGAALVAAGRSADLVVLGSDPAAGVAAFADVRATVQGGRIAHRADGSPTPAPLPLALIGGVIYPAPNELPIVDGAIVVREGKIAAMGTRGDISIPTDATVIDCRGMYLTPGFWNSHVHFIEPVWSDADSLTSAQLTALLEERFSRFGFTTIIDLGSVVNTRGIARRIESREVDGPHIITAGAPIYPPGATDAYPPEFAGLLPIVASPEEGRAAVQRALAGGADVVKMFSGFGENGAMPVAIARAITDEAHRAGRLVFAHPQNAAGVTVAVEADVDVLAHTVSSGEVMSQRLLEAVEERGAALIPTLKLWEFEAAREPQSDGERMMRAALHQVRSLHELGTPILVGTDAGYMPDFDPAGEYQLMARAGLGVDDILASLTTAPSDFLGGDRRGGRIALGLAADIVILADDPGQGVDALSRVVSTIRRGRMIYPNVLQSLHPQHVVE